jgi:alpha-galactosidase
LYEKHKNWVIHLPNRDEYYFRNQMVLDLSNPEVQDFVFSVVDGLMTKYPGIAFFKWDCNSPITNIYSPHLKDKLTHLYVDYVRGLYAVLDRIKAKYPNLPMMLCSGGGGRLDYKALSYYTEFWASDNTDPIERLFIQYAYSFFYPAKATCAHVTTWNRNASIKFRTDVAMMGKLGFDIKLTDMNSDEVCYCNNAVKNYNTLKPIILDGDMYRLVSPYDGDHASTMFVSKEKDHAVVFSFDIYPRFGDRRHNVRLKGLDADKRYKVKEINMMPGQTSWLSGNEEIFSGDYLMNVGLDIFTGNKLNSRVIEIVAQ